MKNYSMPTGAVQVAESCGTYKTDRHVYVGTTRPCPGLDQLVRRLELILRTDRERRRVRLGWSTWGVAVDGGGWAIVSQGVLLAWATDGRVILNVR